MVRGKFMDEDNMEVKGRDLGLHHVKWAESHDLHIKQGITVTLKVCVIIISFLVNPLILCKITYPIVA